ncbi:MAG: endonuclease/exonuclease/phosphatase family protein [Clostridia bacterium]|nr:endonuclease/exonuclease/phosphatase family protein [Clostridia bacterium]
MKKSQKILLSVFAVILVLIITFSISFYWYYPHYKEMKKEITIQKNYNENELRVMSCNVRCISPTDLGKKSWFYRADLIMQGIEKEQPSVIGFQEVTKWHYSYLCDTLPTYDSVITYRDDAFNSEGCPIFFRSDIYTLIDKGSFWLSETPDVMSKSWGAQFNRVCSYVILKDNTTETKFVVFNTHLSHVSDEARINGIQVVLDKILEFGSLPAVLMGDLNAEEDSKTYISATANFLDVKYQVENPMISCTYQDWGKQLDRNCIDYVMISKQGLKVNSYKVVTDTYDGVYSSDHFPLSVSLSFE